MKKIEDILIAKEFFFDYLCFCLNYLDDDSKFECRTECYHKKSVHKYYDGDRIYEENHRLLYIYNATYDHSAINPIDDILTAKLVIDGLGHQIADSEVVYYPDSPLRIENIQQIIKENGNIFDYPYLPYLYHLFINFLRSRCTKDINIICDFTEEEKLVLAKTLGNLKESLVNNKNLTVNYTFTENEFTNFVKELEERERNKNNFLEELKAQEIENLKNDPNIILFNQSNTRTRN